jgi:hypothetical protein
MMAVSINVNVKMPDLGSTNVTKGIKNICLNIRISENILCTLILLFHRTKTNKTKNITQTTKR